MVIKKMQLGEMQTNCYVVTTNYKNAVVIDCGDNPDQIMEYVDSNDITIKKILLTHGHFDHVGAVAEIAKKTNAEVFIHTEDLEMLTSSELNLSKMLPNYMFSVYKGAVAVNEGDVITLDELEFKVLHTPGHTKGGVCYICNDNIFTGDTLFAGNVGRTDFPGGSYSEIINSVNKIAQLEGNYNIYTGHGANSTLDNERENNVYIKGNVNDDNI